MTLQPGSTVLGNRKNYLWCLLMENIASLETSIARRKLADECQVFNLKYDDESDY